MTWLIVDYFSRLEQFVLDCPSYDGTLPTKVALFMSYNAWCVDSRRSFCVCKRASRVCGTYRYTYIFLAIQTIYDRSMFHWMIWAGLTLNGLAVWGVDLLIPHSATGDKLASCAQHSEQLVCPEAAVVAFVVVFFLTWDLYHGGDALWADFTSFMWLIMYTTTSLVSLYALELYMIQVRVRESKRVVDVLCMMLV